MWIDRCGSTHDTAINLQGVPHRRGRPIPLKYGTGLRRNPPPPLKKRGQMSEAVRQLANYIKQSLKGKENEELRSYAKATNKVANTLTHRRTSTKTEMLLCVNATVALINFIGILEGKSWSY